MAKFQEGNVRVRDNKKIQLGNDQDSNIWWDGSDARIDTTISGVTPTQDYHLTRKDYVDTQDTTISGDIINYVDSEIASVSGVTTLIGLTDTPGNYDNGKYLKSTTSGTEWATVSGGGGISNHGEVLTVSGTYTGRTFTIQSDDASVAFGSPVRIASDGHLERACASEVDTMPCSFIAVEAGSGNIEVVNDGYVCQTDWDWTPGQNIYVATTDGNLTETPPSTAGQWIQKIGTAISADTIVVTIHPEYRVA